MARRKCSALTLVLLVFSAPVCTRAAEDISLTEIKQTNEKNSEPPTGIKDMDVSKIPEPKSQFVSSKSQVFFPYESSMSPRFGMGTDSNRISNNEYYFLYGLQYQFAGENGLHWEAGGDVLSDGTGVVSLGRKWRYFPTEAMRPYLKLAGALHIDPSEQLTTFLRTENFQIRPAVGFEYFLEHPSSVRLELESWFSMKKRGLHFCIGYSYAF